MFCLLVIISLSLKIGQLHEGRDFDLVNAINLESSYLKECMTLLPRTPKSSRSCPYSQFLKLDLVFLLLELAIANYCLTVFLSIADSSMLLTFNLPPLPNTFYDDFSGHSYHKLSGLVIHRYMT